MSEQPGTVFAPWKRHTTILGIRLNYLPRLLITALAGIVLFFVVGTIHTTVEQPLGAAEKLAATANLETMRDAIISYEQLAEVSGSTDMEKLDMTDEERERVHSAFAAGVTASSTHEDLSKLVPATKTVNKEAVDPFIRAVLCVAVPMALCWVWHMEMAQGFNLHYETTRLMRYARMQKLYLSRKRSYLKGE